MREIRIDTDLTPVTEFRAHAAALIERVRATRRPLVLTQHGRGAAVLVDVGQYQDMLEMLAGRHDAGVGSSTSASLPVGPVHPDPVDAYKEGIDRSLIRANLSRPVAERLRRLTELAEFSARLRRAPRRELAAEPEAPSSANDGAGCGAGDA